MNQSYKNSICLESIYKSFHKKKVLEGVSLNLQPGSIFGLIGLNGAGKTTLIRILLGLVTADKGNCTVLGMHPADHKKEYYRKTGVVLEHNGFFGNLTVKENLDFFSKARGITPKRMNEYFQEHWAHTAIGKDTRKIKYFSRGQKMQCALCRAFLGWPKVYFFDEPAVALDIHAYDQFCDLIKKAHSQKATIIISSHQLDAIEELCTSIGILEDGNIKLIEDLTQKKSNYKWLIKSEFNEEYKNIIDKLTGEPPSYNKCIWSFSVQSEQSEIIIPKIVTQLVNSGCNIYEVKPDKEGFRKSIRNYIG